MVDRLARVSEEMKKAISDILKNEAHDPCIPDMLSIVNVEVSRDFAHAKVYYSLLDPSGAKEVEKALTRAAGFVRRGVGARIKLRRTPELHFKLDQSIERVQGITRLIADTMKDDMDKNARYHEDG